MRGFIRGKGNGGVTVGVVIGSGVRRAIAPVVLRAMAELPLEEAKRKIISEVNGGFVMTPPVAPDAAPKGLERGPR